MHNMIDRDSVLRFAALAANNHGREVGKALGELAVSPTVEAIALATERLRTALVTLASGYEGSAHDGSTYAARKAAAESAIEAWDGPATQGEGQCTIVIGPISVICSAALARAVGWTVYTDGTTAWSHTYSATSMPPVDLLARVLGEGHRGDAAMMRMLAIRSESAGSDHRDEIRIAQLRRDAAADERAAEGMRLARERARSKASEQ